MNQQIYRVKINELTPEKPDCLSCTKDSACHYWKAEFSQLQFHVALTCLGPSVPYVKIFDKVSFCTYIPVLKEHRIEGD